MSTPVSRLVNLGDADISGFEVELTLLPTENLIISLGYGYIDAELNSPDSYYYNANFGTGANAFAGDQFFMNGSKIGGPDSSINGMVVYQLDNITLQADFNWNTDSTGLGGNEITYTGDRTLVNLRVFYEASDGWELSAFVENAFDEEYIDGMYALAGSDYAYGNMGMPRWGGIKIGKKF
jgi:outer membrane receptor protein involved in Fe transport